MIKVKNRSVEAMFPIHIVFSRSHSEVSAEIRLVHVSRATIFGSSFNKCTFPPEIKGRYPLNCFEAPSQKRNNAAIYIKNRKTAMSSFQNALGRRWLFDKVSSTKTSTMTSRNDGPDFGK